MKPYLPGKTPLMPAFLPLPERRRNIPEDALPVVEQAVLNMLLAGWEPPGPDAALSRAEWASQSPRINREFDRWVRRNHRPRHAQRRTPHALVAAGWDRVMRVLGY